MFPIYRCTAILLQTGSEEVANASPSVETPAKTAEAAVATPISTKDVSKMQVSQLKHALKERGMRLVGLKADLAARLLEVNWRDLERLGGGEWRYVGCMAEGKRRNPSRVDR